MPSLGAFFMSLDLDARQRAMLQEMHIKVWWPRSAPPVAPVEAAGVPAHLAPAAQPGAVARPQAVAIGVTDRLLVESGPGAAPAGDIDAMDWPVLATAVSTCSACRLCTGRKAAVFTAEPLARQADWLLVGEPPDEDEERAGRPFAGPAGQLLDNMLRAVNVSRDGQGRSGARLTNVVKCRPAVVRNPDADELARCAMYLRREIALVQPRVILALGRFAAQAMLGAADPELARLPFGKLRGQVYRYQGVPVVVTHHPSRLLRAGQDKADAWADLCLAQEVAARTP